MMVNDILATDYWPLSAIEKAEKLSESISQFVFLFERKSEMVPYLWSKIDAEVELFAEI